MKPHNSVGVTFALAYPDVYEVGMSHLGIQILYELLNLREDVAAERVFAPWRDMEAEMRARGIPLFALESREPINRFDIVGFSLQYELTYTNVINMLDMAGIPLKSVDRTEEDPLVCAGGPCAFNPEPLAQYLDFVVLGDGEEVVNEVVDVYKHWKLHDKRKGGRKELLYRLAAVNGVYVPEFYQVKYNSQGTISKIEPVSKLVPFKVSRRIIKNLDDVRLPVKPVVPFAEVVHDRAMVELFRGCDRSCRFCFAGMIYRPVRERSPESIKDLARQLVRATGHEELGLVSLSSADYSLAEQVFPELANEFRHEGVNLSLPSLRVDSFSVNLASSASTVRKSGLTFAPEAGTQRLRNVINKGITFNDIVQALTTAFETGWHRIKLYFMIGLPTESYEDLDGIAEMVSEIKKIYKRLPGRRPKLDLTINVSNFVPKPHTPFQWEPQLSMEELTARQDYLRKALRPLNVRLNFHDVRASFLEAVLSRGDRRLGDVIWKAFSKGCTFDGWREWFRFPGWLEAFLETGTDPSFYATRRREFDEVFPWDHLDCGVRKQFLLEELQRAYKGELTPDCRWSRCPACGVCADYKVKNRLASGKRSI